MFELLFAAGREGHATETSEPAAGWDRRDGFRVDADGDIEASPELPFADAGAESLLWSYLRFSTEPIFVVDDTGEFVYSNSECRTLFDRAPGELIGTNLFEYDNADNSAMREVLDTGEALRGLSEDVVTDDGEEIPVERYLYPLYGDDGDLVGGIEINRDVSERVSAQRREEQLEQLRAYQSRVADQFGEWLAALGRGDYTIDPEVPEPEADFEDAQEVYDSFESMAASLRAVVDNANGMLGDVDEGTRELDRLGERLTAAADESGAAVERIDDSADEVADAARNQVDRATEAEEATAELSASIEEITATTEGISEQASQAHDLADDGMAAAETAADRMSTVADSSERNVTHVRDLQNRMDEVREMTDRIADIAEQTNMLALNASIEAARAGDGGGADGFAVVATEIEGLADETKETVAEISTTLEDLGTDIEETATAIERSNQDVTAAAEAVADVRERLTELDEAVAETDEGVAQIADATDDQATHAQTTQGAVEDLVAQSERVDERVADIATQVDEQSETVGQVQAVADDVEEIAARLRDDLAAFELADR
jgi:PAS domain S-box-containing protein